MSGAFARLIDAARAARDRLPVAVFAVAMLFLAAIVLPPPKGMAGELARVLAALWRGF